MKLSAELDYKTIIYTALIGAVAVYIGKRLLFAGVEKLEENIKGDRPDSTWDQIVDAPADDTFDDFGM